MKNETRIIDLSTKLNLMGEALIKEGNNNGDYSILETGRLITFISTLIMFEEDIPQFMSLCHMFSAKRILDSMTLPDDISPAIAEHIKKTLESSEDKAPQKVKRTRTRKSKGKDNDTTPENKD